MTEDNVLEGQHLANCRVSQCRVRRNGWHGIRGFRYRIRTAINFTVEGKINMILTPEKKEEFESISRPMIKWLNDNCHPHVHVIIDNERAELSEGALSFHTEEYFKG